MKTELEERARILVLWITHNPDLLINTELLTRGILIELEAAYHYGKKTHDDDDEEPAE